MSVNLTRRFQISSNLSKRLGWKDCSPNAVTASTNPVFDPAHGRRCESIWVRNSSSAATRLVARVRCVGVRLLRPGQTNLRCPDAERTYAFFQVGTGETLQGPGDDDVPVCKSAGGEERKMGSRFDGGEDEGLSVAQTQIGGAIRICGMDTRRSSPAFEVRGGYGRTRGRRMRFGRVSAEVLKPH